MWCRLDQYSTPSVIAPVNGDGDETRVRQLAAEREHIAFAASRSVQCNDDGMATGKICGLHQNSRHAITRIGGEGKMKLCEAICIRHWINLRRERNARTVNELEKISARFKMRAARYPKQQQRQWENAFHAGCLPEAGVKDKL